MSLRMLLPRAVSKSDNLYLLPISPTRWLALTNMHIPSKDFLDSLPRLGSGLWSDLMTMLTHIDIAIAKCDVLLEGFQPKHTGCIRIEWWETRSAWLTGKTPYPVIWRRSHNGHWGAERVSPKGLVRRARTAREFGKTAGATREILRRTQELLEMRVKVVNLMALHSRTVKNLCAANMGYLDKITEDLDQILAEAGIRSTPPESGGKETVAVQG